MPTIRFFLNSRDHIFNIRFAGSQSGYNSSSTKTGIFMLFLQLGCEKDQIG
jgi:hypothetical protein